MNGVLMPSTSAGSSQRGGRVTWTPQVSVPSGAAAAGPKLESSAANTTMAVDVSGRIDSSSRRFHRCVIDGGSSLPQNRRVRRGGKVATIARKDFPVFDCDSHVVDLLLLPHRQPW